MAEIIWTEPAHSDLDAIADFIALHNPTAARALVRQIVEHVEQLAEHPLGGSKLPELEGWRQIVERPCRVIYRHEKGVVHVLHVVRGERLLDQLLLSDRDESTNT